MCGRQFVQFFFVNMTGSCCNMRLALGGLLCLSLLIAVFGASKVLERSPDKCYVNNHVYELGELLKEEDANPCDIGCFCSKDITGVGKFACAIVDCFHGPIKPGCYLKRSPLDCCPGGEVCPENPEDRAKCDVDGKIYRDGDWFLAEEDPNLSCVCQEGYKGENVEPFCVLPKRPYSDQNFRQWKPLF